MKKTKEQMSILPKPPQGDLFCHDASYPSDNDAEIPNLRMDMMADECTKG